MFEKFTDRSRQVMKLSIEAARKWQHPCRGPEHIMLALIDEGHGIASHVLRHCSRKCGLSVKTALENILHRGPEPVIGATQDLPSMHKLFNDAFDEARQLGHNYVGTEHLLLGLLKTSACEPLIALTRVDTCPGTVREEVLKMLGVQDKLASQRVNNELVMNDHELELVEEDEDDEDVECENPCSTSRPGTYAVWTTKDGRKVPVTDMENIHLLHTIRYMERNGVKTGDSGGHSGRWLIVLKAEALKRGLDWSKAPTNKVSLIDWVLENVCKDWEPGQMRRVRDAARTFLGRHNITAPVIDVCETTKKATYCHWTAKEGEGTPLVRS